MTLDVPRAVSQGHPLPPTVDSSESFQPPSPPARPGRVVFLFACAAAVVAVLGFVAWIEFQWGGESLTIAMDDIGEAIAAFFGAACCAVAARQSDGQRMKGWWLLAASAGSWGVGEVIWSIYEVGLGIEVPFPSAADAGFLGAIPLAAAGILMFFITPGSAAARVRLWVDGAIAFLAVLSISWAVGLSDVYQQVGDGPIERLIGVAYPVGDIVIGIILILAIRRARYESRGRLMLLLGGLAANALADSAFAYLTAAGAYGAIGNVLDVGWIAGYLMIGLAAILPAEPVIQPTIEDEEPADVWQVAMPWVAILTEGANAILLSATGHHLDTFIEVLLAVTAVLVMASQLLAHKESLSLLAKSRLNAATLNDIILYAPLGVVRISVDLSIIHANPRMATILRRQEQELVALRLSDFLPPEEIARAAEQFRALSEGSLGATDSEVLTVRADGTSMWLHWSATEVRNAAGEVDYFVAMFWDTTSRHEAEGAAMLNLTVLERLDRLKGEFLRMVSHEFRTALVGIQGFSELIRDTKDMDPDEIKSYANEIYNDSQRLDAMLATLLAKDTAKADRTVMQFAPVDLGTMARETVAKARASADAHVFAIHVDADLALVPGDASRLTQVLNILLSNATKYSPRGSEINVSVRGEGGQQVVTVSDHGMGMPADFDDKLFAPRPWTPSSEHDRIIRTGLGLPMARQIIEMHGGRIWFESTIGVGSEFHFSVPLRVRRTGQYERRLKTPTAVSS